VSKEDIMNKLRWGLILLFVSMLPWPALAGVPLDTVKAHANAVLDILRDPKLQGEAGKKIKEQRIEAAADDLFDFVELSKRTLGLNWNKLTLEQRKEFVRLFTAILRDAYVDKVASYTNEQVNFTKEVPLTETTVEVQSVVVSKSGQVLITYRVIKEENGWKVYDVVIEGVSLVSNYRTQFREILGNNPPEKLLDTLRKRQAGK
jgi:phospholipid transport system substrate-binding protein